MLYVGRMVREKGAHVLVEAAPLVLAQAPMTRFVLAGGGNTDGLQARARALGVASRVHLPGFVSETELRWLYHVAAAAVYPSLYEPFGIVALEAMAARVPVVTSDIGGLVEVVRHRETGLHTWANNPDSLAWGILQVLQDPALARRLCAEGARVAREEYNWDAIAEKTLQVYAEVLAPRRAPRRRPAARTPSVTRDGAL